MRGRWESVPTHAPRQLCYAQRPVHGTRVVCQTMPVLPGLAASPAHGAECAACIAHVAHTSNSSSLSSLPDACSEQRWVCFIDSPTGSPVVGLLAGGRGYDYLHNSWGLFQKTLAISPRCTQNFHAREQIHCLSLPPHLSPCPWLIAQHARPVREGYLAIRRNDGCTCSQRSSHREEMCRAKVRGRQVGMEVVNTGACMGVSAMAGDSASSHATWNVWDSAFSCAWYTAVLIFESCVP